MRRRPPIHDNDIAIIIIVEVSVTALRLRRYLSISYWLLIITLDYTGTSFPRSQTTFSSKQSIIVSFPFLTEKRNNISLNLLIAFLIYHTLEQWFSIQLISIILIYWEKSRDNRITTECNVKGGALWGASPCLLSARACPTATHIVVTSACAWESVCGPRWRW